MIREPPDMNLDNSGTMLYSVSLSFFFLSSYLELITLKEKFENYKPKGLQREISLQRKEKVKGEKKSHRGVIR